MRSSVHSEEPDHRDAEPMLSDDHVQADSTSSDASGERLRRVLLIANVALWVLACLVQSSLGGDSGFLDRPDYLPVIVSFAQTSAASVLLLSAALAAWGPGTPAARGLCLVIVVGLATVVRAFFTMRAGTILLSVAQAADECLGWLIFLVPAVYCMVVLGSWLRLRIGPASRGPVRVTILGLMAATAILSLLVVAKSSFTAMLQSGDSYSRSVAELHRTAALVSVAFTGPFLGLAIACIVGCAYRWWARLLALFAIASFGATMWYFASQMAPQFPAGEVNLLVLIYAGMILGMIAAIAWVAFCVRMLDRSGWPCSRR